MLMKVKLAVETGPQAGAECRVDAPATCVIGSTSDADFPVIGARPRDVAPRQCRIEVTPNGARICDLSSPSGTFVNGKPVTCIATESLASDLQMHVGVELADGDHVTFGGISLAVVLTTDQPSPATLHPQTTRRSIAGVLTC